MIFESDGLFFWGEFFWVVFRYCFGDFFGETFEEAHTVPLHSKVLVFTFFLLDFSNVHGSDLTSSSLAVFVGENLCSVLV